MDLQPWSRPLPAALAHAPLPALPALTRLAHRDAVRLALRSHAASPTLLAAMPVPYLLLAAAIALPHARLTRWPALAAVWALGAYNTLYACSLNLGIGYIGGFGNAFFALRAWNLLVGLDVQRDAARVVRRPRRPQDQKKKPNGGVGGVGGVVDKREGPPDREAADQGFEYVWQFYPAEASFVQRLGWAADLIFSFRGDGWNIAIPPLAGPDAAGMRTGDAVDVDAIPLESRYGFKRFPTPAAFFRDRLAIFAYTYLLLDFFGVFMGMDPYFSLGPDALAHYQGGLPHHLADMPPVALFVLRRLAAIAGIYGAIVNLFALLDILYYFLALGFFPSKGGVRFYASTFGSFQRVLDRGLPGWWGSFWHQTFRMTLVSPVTYLLNKGYLKKRSTAADAAALLVSFFMSGLVHAAGSISSAPLTKPWRSALFFFLQPLGISVQWAMTSAVARLFPSPAPPSPRRVLLRRAFHLVFVTAWLLMTCGLFFDDVSNVGMWLTEPVPISLFRPLGYGPVEDSHWWRWDSNMMPRYVQGDHWWQSGWAL